MLQSHLSYRISIHCEENDTELPSLSLAQRMTFLLRTLIESSDFVQSILSRMFIILKLVLNLSRMTAILLLVNEINDRGLFIKNNDTIS